MLAMARALTHRWVGFYTIGLPKVSAQARRAEIDSDLWEQVAWASAGTAWLAGHIFARTILGVPADISWHIAELGGPQMERSITTKALSGGIVILGGLSVLAGIGLMIGLSEGSWSVNDGAGIGFLFFIAVVAGLVGPFAALAGAYELRRAETEARSQTAGRALLIAGTLGIAAIGGAMYWTIIGPVVAGAIVLYWLLQLGGWWRDQSPLS